MATVVIDMGSSTLAKMIYLALGMGYLAQHLALPTEVYVSLVLTIGLISLGFISFIVVQLLVLSTLGVAHVYGLAFGIVARAEQLAANGCGMLAYALVNRFLSRVKTAAR